MHQPVELAARVIELAVDQGQAFGNEPHMGDGGLGRARASLTAGARSWSRRVEALIRRMRCCFNTLVSVTSRTR